MIIIIPLLSSLISVNGYGLCEDMDLNVSECVANYTFYSGTAGNCGTDVIGSDIVQLEECMPDESGETFIYIECVNGYYLRNQIYNTSDCTGDYINIYDGLGDDCYEISCPSFSCSCTKPPCDAKCTSRSDATCTFDCCDGIWYVFNKFISSVYGQILKCFYT